MRLCGILFRERFPLSDKNCRLSHPASLQSATSKNPYLLGDQPGGGKTQRQEPGMIDAQWGYQPSRFTQSRQEMAATISRRAVNFAREK